MTNAQKLIKQGYSETDTKNLSFIVKCKNYSDFKACLNIINAYNNFSAKDIIEFMDTHFDKLFLSKLTFEIGRDYSPVFLISHTYTEYAETLGRFMVLMKRMSQTINCDDFHQIDTTTRFWFD
jgi:hypothetical protein